MADMTYAACLDLMSRKVKQRQADVDNLTLLMDIHKRCINSGILTVDEIQLLHKEVMKPMDKQLETHKTQLFFWTNFSDVERWMNEHGTDITDKPNELRTDARYRLWQQDGAWGEPPPAKDPKPGFKNLKAPGRKVE
jgi:hypothetical protein